jgi:hypothetical protein
MFRWDMTKPGIPGKGRVFRPSAAEVESQKRAVHQTPLAFAVLCTITETAWSSGASNCWLGSICRRALIQWDFWALQIEKEASLSWNHLKAMRCCGWRLILPVKLHPLRHVLLELVIQMPFMLSRHSYDVSAGYILPTIYGCLESLRGHLSDTPRTRN